MKHCVNIHHSDVADLSEQMKLPKIVVAAKIALWQEVNGLDNWPKLEDIQGFTSVAYNFKIVNNIIVD